MVNSILEITLLFRSYKSASWERYMAAYLSLEMLLPLLLDLILKVFLHLPRLSILQLPVWKWNLLFAKEVVKLFYILLALSYFKWVQSIWEMPFGFTHQYWQFLNSGEEFLGVGLSVCLSVGLSVCLWKKMKSAEFELTVCGK